jgi:hypothetical protein
MCINQNDINVVHIDFSKSVIYALLPQLCTCVSHIKVAENRPLKHKTYNCVYLRYREIAVIDFHKRIYAQLYTL